MCTLWKEFNGNSKTSLLYGISAVYLFMRNFTIKYIQRCYIPVCRVVIAFVNRFLSFFSADVYFGHVAFDKSVP